MTYEEFIQRRRDGTIRAGIDQSAALRLIDYLPRRYRAAHHFWTWVWILSIPGFISVSIFWKWWAGLLLLIFVTRTISHAVKKSAAEFVLTHAEKDREFFEKLAERNLLVFQDSRQ